MGHTREPLTVDEITKLAEEVGEVDFGGTLFWHEYGDTYPPDVRGTRSLSVEWSQDGLVKFARHVQAYLQR